VAAALGQAAADLEPALRIAGASNPDIDWFSRVRRCARTLSEQIEILDDNTDSQIELTALSRNFDRSQTVASEDFGLVDAETWLNGYWNVLLATLNTLNDERGAQQRISLKLLVKELCSLWERETGEPVAAHGIKGDVYTACAETTSGQFVTAAVEAMLPEQSWFDQRTRFAAPVRAMTIARGDRHRQDRARQTLVIMRDFVARRPRSGEMWKPTI
jgi:hypothetical protein